MTDTQPAPVPGDALPPGVHPNDQSGPEWAPPVEPAATTWSPARFKPFDVPNANATAVWERATTHWSTTPFTLQSQSGTIAIAGRVVGRKAVTIWVPSTASFGVQLSEDRGSADQGLGTPLNPGDSITIPTEAPVYAGVQVGQTTGTVYVMDCFNVAAPVPD